MSITSAHQLDLCCVVSCRQWDKTTQIMSFFTHTVILLDFSPDVICVMNVEKVNWMKSNCHVLKCIGMKREV